MVEFIACVCKQEGLTSSLTSAAAGAASHEEAAAARAASIMLLGSLSALPGPLHDHFTFSAIVVRHQRDGWEALHLHAHAVPPALSGLCQSGWHAAP